MERDAGNIFLTQEAVDASDEDPTNQLIGSSVTYRIAVGPQQGRKVMTLQTLPIVEMTQFSTRVGNVAGFSLHAGVATKANERAKLERLVPLYHQTGSIHKAAINDPQRQGALRAEDTLAQWHHPCHI